MHLMNHDYFDYGKNPKTPKLSPMLGSRWRRVWYLWCISVDMPLKDNQKLWQTTRNWFSSGISGVYLWVCHLRTTKNFGRNQKLQPGCPWEDNLFHLLNLDAGRGVPKYFTLHCGRGTRGVPFPQYRSMWFNIYYSLKGCVSHDVNYTVVL